MAGTDILLEEKICYFPVERFSMKYLSGGDNTTCQLQALASYVKRIVTLPAGEMLQLTGNQLEMGDVKWEKKVW